MYVILFLSEKRGADELKITIINDHYFTKLSGGLLKSIEDAAPGYSVWQVEQKGITVSDLIDSEIIFGRMPPQMLKELINLKWLHMGSAGADGMTDISLYANKSIILTKSSGTFGIPIAEHIIGMMIALNRNFGYYYKKQREGEWCSQWPTLSNISGSTVLVLGLGDIGSEVCTHLSSFDCNIIGFRRDTSKPHEIVSDVRPLSKLRESLPEADYVIICMPVTDETQKLFGREEFELMKESAKIINIGRGAIIDTDALVEALNQQKIAGAGLDVTDPEPLPTGHPLFFARNVLVTPHVSAATQLTTERRVMVFIDLLKRYVAGQEMYNFVDFKTGY
jgi:phosphoglycerate dehydrogenase-like enzyme